LVVERYDALGRRSRQVGANEADTRVKLIGVLLDLRHDPPEFLPALRLIAEAGEVAAHLVRRSPDWALEQISYLVLDDPVGRQPDCGGVSKIGMHKGRDIRCLSLIPDWGDANFEIADGSEAVVFEIKAPAGILERFFPRGWDVA
jgi:hypothetical protein